MAFFNKASSLRYFSEVSLFNGYIFGTSKKSFFDFTNTLCFLRKRNSSFSTSHETSSDINKIANLSILDNEYLEVDWKDFGNTSSYSTKWLRSKCQCKNCMHPLSKEPISTVSNYLNHNILEYTNEGTIVEIKWGDGHYSAYESQWLQNHKYISDLLKTRNEMKPLKKITWNRKRMQNNINSFSFDELVESDKALFHWICVMEKYGFAIINEAPINAESLIKLESRIAFSRDYINKEKVAEQISVHKISSHKNSPLEFQADLCDEDHSPGIRLIHCLEQESSGNGKDHFGDGFYTAEKVKSDFPAHFNNLSQIKVSFSITGSDFYDFQKHYSFPIIDCDDKGKIDRISYNTVIREAIVTIPFEISNPLYEAIKCFHNIVYNRENHISVKLKAGDIVCTDLHRILHGRTNYTGTHCIKTSFLKWDQLLSRRRVLQHQLSFNPK